jgi:hypothetical protein
MIKKLLILALALAPLAAFGNVTDRDVVLADDGTVYTVESAFAKDVPGLHTSSERVLTFTVQNGTNATTSVIPATLTGGWHVFPALAYDAQSRTLFVFWESARNNFNNTELLVAAYQNGTWDNATSLDSAHLAARQNLHIALTHSTEQNNPDGTVTQLPEITVHAVWWEDNGAAEWGRYAMITVDKGAVIAIDVEDLSKFASASATDPQPSVEAAREILRHPAIAETRKHDSVDIVFGDMNAATLRRTNVRPTIQGRLRVPIGRGGSLLPAPIAAIATATPVNTILTDDSVAFYYDDAKAANTIDYLAFRNGTWSPVRSIALTDKLSHDAAVSALQRLITAQ